MVCFIILVVLFLISTSEILPHVCAIGSIPLPVVFTFSMKIFRPSPENFWKMVFHVGWLNFRLKKRWLSYILLSRSYTLHQRRKYFNGSYLPWCNVHDLQEEDLQTCSSVLSISWTSIVQSVQRKSGVVYYTQCEKCGPSQAYVGKTTKTLYERFYDIWTQNEK